MGTSAPWSLHTSAPVTLADLPAALVKARDARLRSDERTRILDVIDTDAAAVDALRTRMDNAIKAAVLLADTGTAETVSVSISGDEGVEGLSDRVSVHVDFLAPPPVEIEPDPSTSPRGFEPEED